MRTSRIARDTALVSELPSPARPKPRRQTRTVTIPTAPKPLRRRRISSASSSSLSPPPDIEDHPFLSSPRTVTGKRKRSAVPPAPRATSACRGARTAPRTPKVKVEEEGNEGSGDVGDEGNGTGDGDAKGTGPAKGPRRTAKKVKPAAAADADVPVQPPAHWEEIYDAVREMRRHGGAPVDTMGCERLADPSMSPKDQRFQTLLALMLSAQTRDAITASTIHHLQRTLPGGLTLAAILATPPATLATLIRPVGFHNAKAAHILATAALLARDHGGDIPATAAGLMALPGVGPKMAFLCLSAAWGVTAGIGVDTHVHRVTGRWGWHGTGGPEATRRVLEAWLPRERWREVNGLVVGFGQLVCRPVGPRCGECVVGRRGLCPRVGVGKAGRGVKEGIGEDGVVVKEEDVLEGGRSILYRGEERVKVGDEERRMKVQVEEGG